MLDALKQPVIVQWAEKLLAWNHENYVCMDNVISTMYKNYI